MSFHYKLMISLCRCLYAALFCDAPLLKAEIDRGKILSVDDCHRSSKGVQFCRRD